MSIRVLVSSLCLVLAPSLSQALVNAGNPGGNLTAPTGQDGQPEDPGFANVLTIRGGTGVYLGNGWVLTARHVVPKWVMLDGQKQLQADVIDKEYSFKDAELKLFHLKQELYLPTLKIAATPAPVGAEVVVIGAGRASKDHMTYWQVDRTTKPWVWTQLSGPEGANAAGILCGSSTCVSWGTNRVAGHMPKGQMGPLMVMDFSDDPAQRTAFESQAVSFDSGGPVFARGTDSWEVTAIMATVARLYPDQPGVAYSEGMGHLVISSGFYGNLTLAVDLASYRDEILRVTGLSGE